jgi:3-oxoacyl-[acyl-carrier-protein] synthase-3
MKKAYIKAIQYYLPEKVIDNATINIEHPEWSIEKIAAKTGICNRHIAAEEEFSSDMAIKAAELLFLRENIDRSSIDFIILCTQSPDYFLPTTACILQHKLNLQKNIGAFDFNLGCSGFVYGLGIAKGLIVSGQANNVLLLTAETYSKFIHSKDKNNKTLFGDAAAATLISFEKSEGDLSGEILDFNYTTDGEGSEYLIVKNGGMRHRNTVGSDIADDEGFIRNDDFLYMDGKAIFNFTAFKVPGLVKDGLIRNNFSMEDVDLFIFHQANEYMLQTLRKRCGIPFEKFYIHLKDCANTVSSTIPIALKHAILDNRVQQTNKIFLAGFGVGLSAAAVVIQY